MTWLAILVVMVMIWSSLRKLDKKNGQTKGVRMAEDFREIKS